MQNRFVPSPGGQVCISMFYHQSYYPFEYAKFTVLCSTRLGVCDFRKYQYFSAESVCVFIRKHIEYHFSSILQKWLIIICRWRLLSILDITCLLFCNTCELFFWIFFTVVNELHSLRTRPQHGDPRKWLQPRIEMLSKLFHCVSPGIQSVRRTILLGRLYLMNSRIQWHFLWFS